MNRGIALATAAAVAAVLTLSWLSYRQRITAELERAGTHNARIVTQLADTLHEDFERTALDLRLLAGLDGTSAALRNPDGPALEAARRELDTFTRSRPGYFQVRLIDAAGPERVRFDRDGERVSHAAVLQDKSDRYYMRDLAALPEGQLYVSPMDWNIEFGQIEQPLRPTIRFGLRRDRAVMLLNADARLVFRAVREASAAFQGRLAILDGATGQVLVEAAGGAWTFLPTSPTPHSERDIVQERRVEFGRSWVAASALDRGAFLAQARPEYLEQLSVTGVVVLLIAIAAWTAVRASRRAAQLRHTQRHAAKLEELNAELRRTRELVVERTRLATVGEMVPVLAHELRNPLQAMLTAARSLQGDVRTDESRRLLEIILDEITRLNRIASDLLPGRARRGPEPCDAGLLVRRVVDLVRAGRAEGATPTVELEVAGATTVRAVPDALKQILWNVVLNACQAASPAGHVWIRARRDGQDVAIDVEDDGPGLGAPKPGGHGIGLALCEELIRHQGGSLDLGPSARGGARVRIVVPAHEPAVVPV